MTTSSSRSYATAKFDSTTDVPLPPLIKNVDYPLLSRRPMPQIVELQLLIHTKISASGGVHLATYIGHQRTSGSQLAHTNVFRKVTWSGAMSLTRSGFQMCRKIDRFYHGLPPPPLRRRDSLRGSR